jgi:transcriptional regulator GlxA family with amidase domain
MPAPKSARRPSPGAYIDHDDEVLHPLLLAEFEQLLIVTLLSSCENRYSAELLRGELGSSPWQVRLVEEYIAAHWDKPLSIETLSHETGVGVRSMFHTFKSARGYTPMQFLTRIRLDHARQSLQQPGPNTTVTGVSFKFGFRNPGHFARYYRQRFGEYPSITLANAKGVMSFDGEASNIIG